MPLVASLLLAAAATAPPLGVWPQQAGAAATVVDEVEFFLVEPEDSYGIIAIQPLPTPLATAEPAAVKRLAAVARRLGADAVVLLAEMQERAIPDSVDSPLPSTGRFAFAVFISFNQEDAADAQPPVPARAAAIEFRSRSVGRCSSIATTSGLTLRAR